MVFGTGGSNNGNTTTCREGKVTGTRPRRRYGLRKIRQSMRWVRPFPDDFGRPIGPGFYCFTETPPLFHPFLNETAPQIRCCAGPLTFVAPSRGGTGSLRKRPAARFAPGTG